MLVPKVTVSVPVYNAEKFLRQCLNSLIYQTLKDIEIIVVNDGSTDNSKSICEEYAKKDSRVILINKENGGLASARQAALDVASGVYFCVCDADDWAEPMMYEKLYRKAVETEADIVMCDYISEYINDDQRYSCYGRSIPDNNDKVLDDTLNGRFPCQIWSKLIRRDSFIKFNVSWEKGINMGEDFLMTLKLFKHPLKAIYLKENLYHYRRMPGEDSYTNKMTLASYNQMLSIQDWIESSFSKERYGKGITHYLINIAFAGLRVEDGITSEYYNRTSINRLGVSNLLKERTLKSILVLFTKLFGYKMGKGVIKLLYDFVYK